MTFQISLSSWQVVVRTLAIVALLVAAGQVQGSEDELPVIQWFDGAEVLPDGITAGIRGIRFRASESDPWNVIGMAHAGPMVVPLIQFDDGGLEMPIINWADGVQLIVQETGPRSASALLIPRLSIDPSKLIKDGLLETSMTLPMAPCVFGVDNGAVESNQRGGAGLADADDKCPDNNCTDWLRAGAEKAVAALRKRSPNVGSRLRRVLEKENFRLDRNNEHFPPGQCHIAIGREGGIGAWFILISPECVRNQDVGYVVLASMVLALGQGDRNLRNDPELAAVIAASILADYDNDDPDGPLKDFRLEKLWELIVKVARATGDRKTELLYELMLESRKYRGTAPGANEFDPPESRKLKRMIRELRKEIERCENLPPQVREREQRFRKWLWARLNYLMAIGDWNQIMNEFQLTQECLDPATLVCPSLLPSGCGNPLTPPCLEENLAGGCQDARCCEEVCKEDPHCCDVAWDSECVAAAGACYASSPCGDPDSGDCCEASGAPGCADAACCGTICMVDPFCCDSAWDTLCVQQAAQICQLPCDSVIGCGGSATGSCCEFGSGVPGCSDESCCSMVCDFDVTCCDDQWDDTCVFLAQMLCPQTCDGLNDCFDNQGDSPCVTSNLPYANDPICCASVCDIDPFCCDDQWDQLCVLLAQVSCPDLCSFPPPCPGKGGCLESQDTPGCEDISLCETVCAVDSFCCEVAWDEVCASLANAAELNTCPLFCDLGDLNDDGVVNVSDLLILLGAWGTCDHPGNCPADLNFDGVVNVSDLLLLLSNWG